MAKSTKGSIGSYSRGKLEKIIDDRVDTSAAGSAFTNIAVSGQSTVVSDGATDTLTLAAGDNVTITTNAGTDTVTISAASDSVFKTISVSGQSDVVADSATDTLTLVAGSNMTITTNASGDSITFASSGAGGGDTAITGTLDVTGIASLQGAVEIVGAADLASTLIVAGATIINDNAAISGTLDVTGATSLQGAVEVVGAADLASTLIVGGATTLNGKFTGSNGFDLQDGGSSLIKGDDTNGIVFGSNWTAASKTCANLGTVTTADINGGSIDGTTIGAASAQAGTFTAIVGTSAAVSGTLDVTGNTSLQGTLEVVGDSTLNGAVNLGNAASDITTVVGKLTASNGLSVTGDVSFDNASFTGDVTLGDAVTDVTTVTGQLTASNGLNTTAATVTDGLTVSAGTTAVQALTATTISGSSTLQVGGTADFDDNVTMDNNLTVSGITTLAGQLTASNGINTTAATVTDGLTVSAGTTAVQALTATTISGSSALQVGGTADFDGNVTMDNDLAVAGTTTVVAITASNGATITGSLRVKDEAEFANELSGTTIRATAIYLNDDLITAGVDTSGNNTWTGTNTFSSKLTASNGMMITNHLVADNGTITVTGQLTASAGATITGSARFANEVEIADTLDVTGNTSIGGTLSAGVTNLTTLTASNGIAITGSLRVKDEAEFASELSGTIIRATAIYLNDDAITAGVNTGGDNTWTGTNIFSSKLTASNGMMITNHLLADDGTVTISGQLTASSGATITGSARFASEVEMADTLDVTGNTTIAGTLSAGVTNVTTLTASNGIAITGSLRVNDEAEFAGPVDINSGYIDGVYLGTSTAIPQLTASSLLVDGDFQVNASAKISSLAQDLNVNGYNVTNVSQLDVDGNFDFDGDLDADVDNWNVTATTSWSTTLNGSMTDPQAYFKDGDGTTVLAVNPMPNPAARGLNLYAATNAYFGIKGINQSGSIGCEDDKTQLIISGTNGIDVSGSTNFADSVFISGTLDISEFDNQPDTPDADKIKVFARTGSLFIINDLGETTKIGSGTGGGGGGSTSPGGSDTQIQFNDGGSFAGDSGLTYNKTTDTLSVTNLTSSNGISVSGSFKVNDRVEIGGYLGVGVSEEEVTHGITLPNSSGVDGSAKANAFITYSSIRYKSDVKEIQDPLGKIAQLRGVTYNWIDSGKSDVGLIAEEVSKVMPEIVSFEPNGKDAFGIDYSKLTSLLLASVKAQQDMIETQNKKIEELENKLKKIID